ncbi:MAG: extracellular solute-binding protein [Oscillospiraceae bacterium]|nr:extracellular solute-binding protein [Oscillospiraceae bacterium]
MKRPFFTLITAMLVLATLLAACSGGSGDSNTGSPSTPDAGGATPAPIEIPDYSEQTGISGGEAVDTGTGQDRPDYWPENPEPITFTMFVAGRGQAPARNNPVVAMVEEFTGVSIEFEYLVGDLDQRMGTMIASGDYPDLINPINGRSTFMAEGAFVPIQNQMQNYDNLKRHYEPYYEKMFAASPDDNIYLLDNWDRMYGLPIETFYNGPAFWVQKAVLADAGYIMPKTLDEFFDMLEAYFIKYPTIDGNPTLPFEIISTVNQRWCLLNAPQHLIGGPNDGDVFVNQDTLVAEVYHDKPYAKAYYAKLNEAFKKGLISPETFTRNFDQYLSVISSGRVLAMFDQQWSFENAESVLQNDDKWERTYVPLGLTFEGYEPWYAETKGFKGGNGFGITVKCKDVDRALLYADMLLDEEIQKLMAWGIEDKDYYMDNGRARRTPEQKANADDPQHMVDFRGKWLYDNFPKIQGYFSDGNCVSLSDQPEEILENTSPFDKEFYGNYTKENGQPFATAADFLIAKSPLAYFPVWNYAFRSGTDARIALEELWQCGLNYLPRCIAAVDFDAEWDTYQAELSRINLKAFEDDVTEKIAARMATEFAE